MVVVVVVGGIKEGGGEAAEETEVQEETTETEGIDTEMTPEIGTTEIAQGTEAPAEITEIEILSRTEMVLKGA